MLAQRGALGGCTDTLTLNGILAGAMAGQALGYIKNYVDKHNKYEIGAVKREDEIKNASKDSIQK